MKYLNILKMLFLHHFKDIETKLHILTFVYIIMYFLLSFVLKDNFNLLIGLFVGVLLFSLIVGFFELMDNLTDVKRQLVLNYNLNKRYENPKNEIEIVKSYFNEKDSFNSTQMAKVSFQKLNASVLMDFLLMFSTKMEKKTFKKVFEDENLKELKNIEKIAYALMINEINRRNLNRSRINLKNNIEEDQEIEEIKNKFK